MRTKKRVSLQEFADYFRVTKQTIIAWKKDYNAAFKTQFDAKDIHSVFRFFTYISEVKI